MQAREILYHGSLTDGIACLEPRLRYTPGEESDSPSSIYASDLAAFAAAQSFPWSTDEGVNLYVEDQTVFLHLPASLLPRTEQPVYIYVVDAKSFSLVECEQTGHTFRATDSVPCLEKLTFPNVQTAIEHYNGYFILNATTSSPTC